MNLLFRIVYAAHASGTHHKLALDALRHLEVMDVDLWQRLFLQHANPAYHLPPAAGFAEAVAQVPHVVSFSSIRLLHGASVKRAVSKLVESLGHRRVGARLHL